jgi:hypothetical protein
VAVWCARPEPKGALLCPSISVASELLMRKLQDKLLWREHSAAQGATPAKEVRGFDQHSSWVCWSQSSRRRRAGGTSEALALKPGSPGALALLLLYCCDQPISGPGDGVITIRGRHARGPGASLGAPRFRVVASLRVSAYFASSGKLFGVPCHSFALLPRRPGSNAPSCEWKTPCFPGTDTSARQELGFPALHDVQGAWTPAYCSTTLY